MTGSSSKRPVSGKEQQLWETVTDDVKPLSENKESGNRKSTQENPQTKSESESKPSSAPTPPPCGLPPRLSPWRRMWGGGEPAKWRGWIAALLPGCGVGNFPSRAS